MSKKKFLLAYLIPLLLLWGCDSGGSSGPKNPIRVLVLGDSQSSGGNYPGVAPWPSLLQTEEPEWTVMNLAVPGESSAGGRARITSAISSLQPDLVVIMYGANDAIHSGSPEDFELNISSMVSIAKAANVRVVLVDVMPIFGVREIFNSNVPPLNERLNAIASREKVQLARISREFRSSGAENLFPDGLHPDSDATRIIYAAIRERIYAAASGL